MDKISQEQLEDALENSPSFGLQFASVVDNEDNTIATGIARLVFKYVQSKYSSEPSPTTEAAKPLRSTDHTHYQPRSPVVYPELLDGEAAWEALDAAFRDDPYPDITTILARHRPFIEAAIRAERDAWKVLHDAKSGPYNYGSQEQLRIIIDAKAFLGFTETTR